MQRNLWKVMTQPEFEPGTFFYCGGCSTMFLTLEYSYSMHLHSTFHEICTLYESVHIVRTPNCREITEK